MPHAVSRCLVCSAILAFALCGCQKTVTENLVSNAGLEDPLDGSGLPNDWRFSVASGEYKHETAEISHSGKLAFVIAGSGGSAEARTNAIPVLTGAVLECEAWVQSQFMKGGEPSVCVTFSNGEETQRSEMIRVDGNSADWQQVHFFARVVKDSTAALSVQLAGEGLIRIDDLAVRIVPELEPVDFVLPADFAKLDEKGEFAEWTHVFRSKTDSAAPVPDAETPRIRIEGSAGWSVLCSRGAITTKPSRIILQGAVKVNQGKGQLKIDYLQKGNCFASSYSPQGTSDWTFLSVESDPALVEQADAIRATMAATCGTDYSVEFEAVDVFVGN